MSAPWSKLRGTGNLYALKVSYVTLAVVPFLGDLERVVDWLHIETGWFVVAFFASLSLALANLVYDIACPVLIKRFSSPADMYREMLEIKELSARHYPNDGYEAALQHVHTAFVKANNSKPAARYACFALYLCAGALFGAIAAERVYSVLRLL